MQAEKDGFLKERLFSLGIRPHLKGFCYLLEGARMLLATGRAPTAHELAGAFGVEEAHVRRVLEMCLLLARDKGRTFESADALISAVAAG